MEWLPGAPEAPPGARAQGAVQADILVLGPGRARARVSRSKFRKIRAPQCQNAVKMGGWTVVFSTGIRILRYSCRTFRLVRTSEGDHARHRDAVHHPCLDREAVSARAASRRTGVQRPAERRWHRARQWSQSIPTGSRSPTTATAAMWTHQDAPLARSPLLSAVYTSICMTRRTSGASHPTLCLLVITLVVVRYRR